MNKNEVNKVMHDLGNKIQILGIFAYTSKPKEEFIQAYQETTEVFKQLINAINQENEKE